MSDAPGSRRSSHRAGPSYGRVASRLVPPLAAVSAVVAVVLLLLFLNSRPTTTSGPGPAVVATSAPTTSVLATHAQVASTGPATAAAPSTGPASAVAPPPVEPPPATASPARPPVTVLNNSRITGLAHTAARQVRAAGWPVAHVGNFTGRIRASTIYYAPGQRSAAQAFAHRFAGVRRVLPRFAGLPGSGLTLVVTRDWPR